MGKESDRFEREKRHFEIETYLDVINESVSEIRYLLSRISDPFRKPKDVITDIRRCLKRIHGYVHISNNWMKWCWETKEVEKEQE